MGFKAIVILTEHQIFVKKLLIKRHSLNYDLHNSTCGI